ncbi:MAG: tetratricopeptide repeat protein [Bacteroidaceae bacterium]|nr:tetratricopeptide repeat protein [Bacteroidaceae bacterium]
MKEEEEKKHFESPQFKKILREYEALLNGDDSITLDAEELTDIAEYYSLMQRDSAAAKRCISYALNLYPEAVSPQIFEARLYLLDGDIDKARMICMAIPDQNHREVTYLWAELLVQENQPENALSYLEGRAELYDDDYEYYIYDAAYIFIDYSCFKEAYVLAHQLHNYAPDWYNTWELTADCLLGMAKFEEALKYINKMLDSNPFKAETWNWAAEAHIELQMYNEALNDVEYALALDSNCVRSLVLKGTAFIHLGNYETALQFINNALEINPSDEFVLTEKALCLLDMEQLEEAETTIIEAERIADGKSPDQLYIYEQHASILAAQERYEEAIEYINKASEIDKTVNYESILADYRKHIKSK